MKCSECKDSIYSCENCCVDFEEQSDIYCIEGSHVCKDCLDEWLRNSVAYHDAKVLGD